MKVLVLDNSHPLLIERLTAMKFKCDIFHGKTIEDLSAVIGNYTGLIVRSRFIIDRALMEKAPLLKFIGRVGSGMEIIDSKYASEKGIACLNSPEGNRDAVGEHAVGMLLCLMRNIIIADSQMRNGIRLREENRGVEIKGKTVGIIGYGNMGSAFAHCISGFGANVIAYDKYKQNYSCPFVKEASLAEVMRSSDIISLHLPYTQETHYLADKKFFDSLSKPVFFINTARGKIVNTEHLTNAIKKGKVLGAALDVIEYEDLSFEKLAEGNLPEPYKYLINSTKVVLSPHIAGWTIESKEKLINVLADKIMNILPYIQKND